MHVGPTGLTKGVGFWPVSIIDRVEEILPADLGKILRFGAVSAISVPLNMTIFWLLLRSGMNPVLANLCSVSISAAPNYLLNRYWVWAKMGKNSVRREIAPFWLMTLLGLCLSLSFVWIASQFTDFKPVLLGASFVAFGLIWVLKFFVLEKYLFGSGSNAEAADQMSTETV